MAPRKHQQSSSNDQFTEAERTRFLYRTAEEMRAINDRVEARYRKQMPEHEQEQSE